MAETKKKKPPAKKKKPAAKKKVKEPVVVEEMVEEVIEVVEPELPVVPLIEAAPPEEDADCACGATCIECFEVTEEPKSEPQPEEALVDEPQPPASPEVKPVKKKPVSTVRIGGGLVPIRM